METINVKATASYLSIQKGFEWHNIPQFSVITGVNGAGKTHLLSILKNESHIEIVTSSGANVNFVLPSLNIQNLSVEGLIEYKNNTTQRLARLDELEIEISRYKGLIDNIIHDIEINDNKISKQKLYNKLSQYKEWLRNSVRKKSNIFIYAYEKELESLLNKTEKTEIEEISDSEIREFANPYFNTITEIKDFEQFVIQEEAVRNALYVKLAKEGREYEIGGIRSQERAFEKINRLFKKYGFGYFDMLDPFPTDKSRNGEIIFRGLKGELVQYASLSSGEQMIVKFIVWAMATDIRGNRINTMLLDEPDAHLHPSMCKMMVEILYELSQPKELGGSGIRVIITTHSPSTVAFVPEGSLFVMEKNNGSKRIRRTSVSEAVNILSDGIFTYDKAVKQFSLAINSDKDILIFVEGKTDIHHLKQANKLLDYNLSFEIIDMHDAGALANFIKSTPSKLFPGKKLIALFDADGEGYTAFDKIKGDTKTIDKAKILTAIQCENNSFAMTLIAPEQLNKYCPIEFLYSYDYLKCHDMLVKRNFQEFQSLYKATTPEESIQLADEYNRETGLRPFKTNDSNKDKFSQMCLLETDPQIFCNFKPTLDVIKHIIEYK